MITILSLDLGTTTGYAVLCSNGKIESGSVCFKDAHFDSKGSRYTKFKRWLANLKARVGGIDCIAYEAVARHSSTIAGQTYGGFMGTLQVFGDHHEIPYEGVPVGTIKKFATGKGNASKDDVILAMKDRGHQPVDDNEADALALLYWRMESDPC